jgi:hypothetical protein
LVTRASEVAEYSSRKTSRTVKSYILEIIPSQPPPQPPVVGEISANAIGREKNEKGMRHGRNIKEKGSNRKAKIKL